MTNSNQEKETLDQTKKWENAKIIYFGQILGIVQIILTIVTALFIGTLVYMYNNFKISDFLQSAIVINIAIVLAIGFMSLVIVFLIMYIKTFISCVYAIRSTKDRKMRMNFIKILLLPAFYTFYLRNKLDYNAASQKVEKQNKTKHEKVLENKELDKIESNVSN